MTAENEKSLRVRSKAFSHGGHIPSRYTCEGENINPPIEISGCPAETKSLAMIVEDPDATKGVYDHWLVWNLPPHESIEENNRAGVTGRNSSGNTGYGGPCPPAGSHRYFFKVYALDKVLNIEAGSNKETLQQAMSEHVLASGELMAHYRKKK